MTKLSCDNSNLDNVFRKLFFVLKPEKVVNRILVRALNNTTLCRIDTRM